MIKDLESVVSGLASIIYYLVLVWPRRAQGMARERERDRPPTTLGHSSLLHFASGHFNVRQYILLLSCIGSVARLLLLLFLRGRAHYKNAKSGVLMEKTRRSRMPRDPEAGSANSGAEPPRTCYTGLPERLIERAHPRGEFVAREVS